MMERRRVALLFGLLLAGLVFASACATDDVAKRPGPGQVVVSANCGEPVPAPQHKKREKWTWRNEKGREFSDQVIEVGELTQIKWDNGDTGFYDRDFILRQVKRRNGELVTSKGQYTTIGEKVLNFPLQIGKEWSYWFYGQAAAGGTGLQTYENRYRVVACEEISTPAGKFPALKLEGTQKLVGTQWGGTFYVWYAPSVRNYIKRHYPPSQFFGGGRFLDMELIKYEPR